MDLQVSNKTLRNYFLFVAVFSLFSIALLPLPSFQTLSHSYFSTSSSILGPCAINLYGLPRSFKASVLPSFVKNVVRPNLGYKCDYFVQFDNVNFDKSNGRSDRVGQINPLEVFELTAAIQREYTKEDLPVPLVLYANTTSQEFEETYKPLLKRIRNESVFFPKNHQSYTYATVENVIKMWNSQESVWNLMESQPKHYSRVAMFRSDVVYVTPIDIYELATQRKKWDHNNSEAVVPKFARFPVNDRMIFGPYDAVKIWAAGRFRRLNQHIEYIEQHANGDGLHSERFLSYTIFPAIEQSGVRLEQKPGMCFLRVRADHSIRFSDCGKIHVTKNNQRVIEQLVQRTCTQNWTHAMTKHLVQLDCPLSSKPLETNPSAASNRWHSGCDPYKPKEVKLPPKRRRRTTLWPRSDRRIPTHPPCPEEDTALVLVEEKKLGIYNLTYK